MDGRRKGTGGSRSSSSNSRDISGDVSSGYHQPIPLQLLHPPAYVQRMKRRVRGATGQVRILRTLERRQQQQHTAMPLATPPCSPTSSSAAPLPDSDSDTAANTTTTTTQPTTHYILDRIIMTQPKDVAILLCTPVEFCGGGNNIDDGRSSATWMISKRSSPVVIKAIPKSLAVYRAGSGDSPLQELAAMQILQAHHELSSPSPLSSSSSSCSHVVPLLDCMMDEVRNRLFTK